MALAALETGTRNASTLINYPGFYMFGGHRFGSPENERGGVMDMRRAIVESSNAYFYSLANELGVDVMHDFMKPLGFGQITGIDVLGEVRGVLPSQEWKRNYYKRAEQKKWYAGETISLGIGQGYNSFTMLQLAQATATVANQGIKHQPRLVTSTQDASTHARASLVAPPGQDLRLKPENIAVIVQAMVGVTQEGTSTRVFAGAPYLSGGKTGTAQAVSLAKNEKYNAARMEERLRDHSLYIAFAPAQDPQVALASAQKRVPPGLQNQGAYHHQKADAHKASAVFERQVRARQTADHIGQRHGQHKVPPDMAGERKQRKRGQVAGGVEQLGAGRGVQKIVARHAHQQKHKKAAGTWAEKPVVKANARANGAQDPGFGPPAKAWHMVAPQFFFGQRVNQQEHQQYGQRLAQVMRADLRDQPGPGQTRHQRCHGCGRQRTPG